MPDGRGVAGGGRELGAGLGRWVLWELVPPLPSRHAFCTVGVDDFEAFPQASV